MKKLLIVLAGLALTATTAFAQDPLTAAKKAAQKAASAANAHTEAEQHPEGPQKPAAKVPAAPAPSAPAASAPAPSSPAPAKRGATAAAAAPKEPEMPHVILREDFVYNHEGRRDPFVSLLTTNDLRPTMSDLRLTGILFDHTGRNSVATLRDLTNNAQYRVTTGSALGRMRVAAIKTTTIVFTIEEFGTTRKDSLILRDSTKARAR